MMIEENVVCKVSFYFLLQNWAKELELLYAQLWKKRLDRMCAVLLEFTENISKYIYQHENYFSISSFK